MKQRISTTKVHCIAVFALCCASLWAAPANDSAADNSFAGGFDRFNQWLGEYGINSELEITPIYQQDVAGGKSTSTREGRFSGSYELGFTFDMEKIASIEGGEFCLVFEGGCPSGITDPAVGSHFPVISSSFDNPIGLTEAYWNQSLFDDTLYLRVGKLDMKGKVKLYGRRVAFDGNDYASEKKRQFMNKAFYNNRSIPFPDNGFGAIALFNPTPGFYAAGGLADARGNDFGTGFETGLFENYYFLYMGEVGFMPDILMDENWLPGTYRFGFWYTHDAKTRYQDGSTDLDDAAFYLSCDQMLYKENDVDNDKQGLGGFVRYSFADKSVNPVSTFFSTGLQYQGLFEGRDEDVLGLGFVQGIFSDEAGSGYNEYAERVYELYYEIKTTSWLNITMDLQYITDPGGTSLYDDALVLGTRFNMTF